MSQANTNGDWQPTHTIEHLSPHSEPVMIRDGKAWTETEWIAGTEPAYQYADGMWTYRGAAFSSRITQTKADQ